MWSLIILLVETLSDEPTPDTCERGGHKRKSGEQKRISVHHIYSTMMERGYSSRSLCLLCRAPLLSAKKHDSSVGNKSGRMMDDRWENNCLSPGRGPTSLLWCGESRTSIDNRDQWMVLEVVVVWEVLPWPISNAEWLHLNPRTTLPLSVYQFVERDIAAELFTFFFSGALGAV